MLDPTPNGHWKRGERIWAKIGSWPYWPGWLASEEEEAECVEEEGGSRIPKDGQLMVFFYGQDDSWEWMAPTKLVPFGRGIEQGFSKNMVSKGGSALQLAFNAAQKQH